jgi:hypothetical protein
MPTALTLQDYHYLCLWLVRNINKNPINLSFSLVEIGVPGEKPLQAKLRADYFRLSLFFYLQCLNLTTFKFKVLGLFFAYPAKEYLGD